MFTLIITIACALVKVWLLIAQPTKAQQAPAQISKYLTIALVCSLFLDLDWILNLLGLMTSAPLAIQVLSWYGGKAAAALLAQFIGLFLIAAVNKGNIPAYQKIFKGITVGLAIILGGLGVANAIAGTVSDYYADLIVSGAEYFPSVVLIGAVGSIIAALCSMASSKLKQYASITVYGLLIPAMALYLIKKTIILPESNMPLYMILVALNMIVITAALYMSSQKVLPETR